MSKTYGIQLPAYAIRQTIGVLIILLMQSFLLLRTVNLPTILLALIVIGGGLSIITSQLLLFISKVNEIEITTEAIQTKKITVPISNIEKIIIEGYFKPSVGIKQRGKRLVSPQLHFRFKHDEDKQIREWTQWAEQNGIPVVKGKVYRWL